MGIDPGLTRCGIGIVEGAAGRAPSLIAVGVVRTPADLDVARRLVRLEEGLQGWIDDHHPEAMAIERVFAQHNLHSVADTMQASGIAALVGARAGLPVSFHTPSEVKTAVTGSGRADKAQVGLMVQRLLKLDAPPTPADASDALAIAVCHLWRAPATNRYAAALAAAKGKR
ncbi:MAG TPA: crossover junction endodeoxyribonuclease RuvC [Arachnia sp.]|nr:crossover junction endodeoxyribonuclease RuvC [Arachnia sp.]HMT85725.1 crossover junction endodeoxyribonuclease RuvC [Arachnia sp.]